MLEADLKSKANAVCITVPLSKSSPAVGDHLASIQLAHLVYQHLGIPLAQEKLERPTKVLGIILDSKVGQVHLSEEELDRLRALISQRQERCVCTKKTYCH